MDSPGFRSTSHTHASSPGFPAGARGRLPIQTLFPCGSTLIRKCSGDRSRNPPYDRYSSLDVEAQ